MGGDQDGLAALELRDDLGILGAVCALLTGWFAALDIAKRNYMRAMRSLGLLALATALTFNGFALMI